MTDFGPPELLLPEHEIEDFDCGEASLNKWLKSRALKNMSRDATRVYVLCRKGTTKVVAWYGLSTASISARAVSGSLKRKMPDPIPALLLGRLAVEKGFQDAGLGRALLADCIERSLRISDIGGARLLLTHPLNPAVKAFYERYGFVSLPGKPDTLALDLNQVRRAKQ